MAERRRSQHVEAGACLEECVPRAKERVRWEQSGGRGCRQGQARAGAEVQPCSRTEETARGAQPAEDSCGEGT